MSTAAALDEREDGETLLRDVTALADEAVAAADALCDKARRAVRAMVVADGRIDADALEAEQRAAHGLAWLATYVETLRQMAAWVRRLEDAGRLGALERHLTGVLFGEYLAQIAGGIPMNQGEFARVTDFGLAEKDLAAFRSEGGELRVSLRAQDGQAEIAVADTGSGIRPQDLAQIFDPFFTTKPAGEGNGLGLMVCKGIAGDHGGVIEASSEPGEGTEFRIRLPLAATA